MGNHLPEGECWVRIAAEILILLEGDGLQMWRWYGFLLLVSFLCYLHPAGTPLIWFSAPGKENVIRLVSWLICSVLVTVKVCENNIDFGNVRSLEGAFWAESRCSPDRVVLEYVYATAAEPARVAPAIKGSDFEVRANRAAILSQIVLSESLGVWTD
jgi:hypothetical protein